MFKKHDYYGIQHELDLIKQKYRFEENQSMMMMRNCVEGVIFVLKMNFKEGVAVLNECLENPLFKKNGRIYKNIILSFLAFAHYSIR